MFFHDVRICLLTHVLCSLIITENEIFTINLLESGPLHKALLDML